LRLTPHDYSPSVIRKIVHSAAREPSFREAAEAMNDLAEVSISSRQLDRIAHEVGDQLQADRDERVHQLQAGTLKPSVETRPALAVVEVDGGRLQIRGEGEGPGAHAAAWREDKIAILATMAHTPSECDPEPELPECFADRAFVEKVIGAIGGTGSMGTPSVPAEVQTPVTGLAQVASKSVEPRSVPELMVRTYVATTSPVEQFGPMVAAEARRRNFPAAAAQAFLGDGSPWIWGLHRHHFPKAVAIVDFLHALAHLFTAAKHATADSEGRWELFQRWAEACWKGHVGVVIEELRLRCEIPLILSGGDLSRLAEDDPMRVIARVIGYLEENRGRMDYPSFRRQSLPWTTSHVESTVKVFNRRVKGSEKFWSESGAEAMLQVRAAFLSEDGRLDRHMKEQPCVPFRNYKIRESRKVA
jgi:hypothetical protein